MKNLFVCDVKHNICIYWIYDMYDVVSFWSPPLYFWLSLCGNITANICEAMLLMDLILDMVRSMGFKAEKWNSGMYMEDLATC